MEMKYWLIIISIIIFIFLGAWSIRFPRSRQDWRKDRAETVSMLMSATIFLLFFLLLWYTIGLVDWPDAMTLIVWGTFITFFLLILVGIFLPKGTKLNLKKKDKNFKTADDD